MIRKQLSVTLLGHKDHGKSTLIGRFLLDTGNVKRERLQDAQNLSNLLGRSLEYAFLLDSFQEERYDGMTLDVIHAQVIKDKSLFNFIDVPGHEHLIKNMLTGASQAEAGLLVVSAKEGLEDQTRQHISLAHWLGIKRLIIAVNKMDLVRFDRLIFNAFMEEIRLCLMNTRFAGEVQFVPISAYHGDNVVRPSDRMDWYDGKTVLEHLKALEISNDLSHLPMRFPVQDLYSIGDHTILAGRVLSGVIRIGQEVMILPSQSLSKVKKIHSFSETKALACPGENIGVELDPGPRGMGRGDVCCDPASPPTVCSKVTAQAVFIERPPLHVTVECGLRTLNGMIHAREGIRVGEVSTIGLTFDKQVVLECANTMLGRLAIKRNGSIIGMAVPVQSTGRSSSKQGSYSA